MQESDDEAEVSVGPPRRLFLPSAEERGSAGREGEDVEAFEREAAEAHPELYRRYENLMLYRDFISGRPPVDVAPRTVADSEAMLRRLGPFRLEVRFERAQRRRGAPGTIAMLQRGLMSLSVNRAAFSERTGQLLEAVETFRRVTTEDPPDHPATLEAYWLAIRKYFLAPLCVVLQELKDAFDAIVRHKLFRSGSRAGRREDVARALGEIRYHAHLLQAAQTPVDFLIEWFRTESWPGAGDRAFEEIEDAARAVWQYDIPDAVGSYMNAMRLPLAPEEKAVVPTFLHDADADEVGRSNQAELMNVRLFMRMARYRDPFAEDALAHQDGDVFENLEAFVEPELDVLTEGSGADFGTFAVGFGEGLSYAENFPRGSPARSRALVFFRQFVIRPAAVLLHETAAVARAVRALERADAGGTGAPFDPPSVARAALDVRERASSLQAYSLWLRQAVLDNFPTFEPWLLSDQSAGGAYTAVVGYVQDVLDTVTGSDILAPPS